MQRRAGALLATARRPQRAAMLDKANVFGVDIGLFQRPLRIAGGLLACTFIRSYALNILNIHNSRVSILVN